MTDGHNQQHLDLIMRHQSTGLYPCESEEALGSSESEPAKPARRRGKRSRAAEVHNLSEKRRRSRINEKMKALQSLIPNSSKTDKASMLDDAIEYLKQLQLQVQMLSMRNGLYLPPVNLSGAPEPLPASQMCASLNQNSDKASNPPGVLLPVNQLSGVCHSFDPPYHDQRHYKPLVLPSVRNTTVPEPQFLLESSQSNLRSFRLTVSPEMIFQEDVMLKHRLSSAQDTTSVPGQQSKSFWQETPIVSADCFDRGSLRKEQSQDMKPKNTESVLFMTHLHSLQSGDTESGLRTGTR